MTAVMVEWPGQYVQVEDEKNDSAASELSLIDGLVDLVRAASPETLGRAVFAVSALHAPDDAGLCRVCVECLPRRRFRRDRAVSPCQTLLVLRFTLADLSSVREVGR